MTTQTETELIAKLEKLILELENKSMCKHSWETYQNGNYVIYFNMCNAYIRCKHCGKKERC